MDFKLSEQQLMMRNMAREFLSNNCPASYVREMEADEKGYSLQHWKALVNLGWLSLILPEKYNGSGGKFLDLCILIEETGRVLLPGPLLPALLSEIIILESSDTAQKDNFLPRIADGTQIICPAFNIFGTAYDFHPYLRAKKANNNYILDGSLSCIPYAHVANYIICLARTSANSRIFIVDMKSSHVHINTLKTIGDDKQSEVILDNLTLPSDSMLKFASKKRNSIDRIIARLLIAKSAEMLGAMQKVVDMSADYVKQRIQFNKPIGSFQAIQHHCANMLIDLEASRYLVYKSAWMIDEEQDCINEASITKAWISDAYRRIVILGKQVHGGYGVIKEYDMQLYLRRQKVDELFLGDADYYRYKVAESAL